MSIINLKEKTINAKIVYYGTALGGKTTSLKHVHQVIDPAQQVELVSLNTEQDRTLFFDFLPITLGRIGGFTLRLQGFTVPGQVAYNLTRKYVLTGADAVVLVVDSHRSQLENNIAALANLKENLAANGLDYDRIPLALQYNKRDLDDILPVSELDAALNDRDVPAFETVATEGRGVFEAFIRISRHMVDHISGPYRLRGESASLGRELEENLAKLLARRTVAERPTHGVREEAARSSNRLQITEEEAPEEFPEELLRKAVDSNIEVVRLYSEANEMKNRLRDRVRELTALNEVGRSLSSILDEDRLLQVVLDSATSCLDATHGCVMLLNSAGDSFVERVVKGFLRDPLCESLKQLDGPTTLLDMSRGDGLTGVGDRELLGRVQQRDPRITSLMVAPLLSQDRVMGAIAIYLLDAQRESVPEHLHFLSALGSHAGVALENARLVQRIEAFNRELERKVGERTERLHRAFEELKEMDRMKDDFLSSISHELLTPLTSIRSFSEILLAAGEGEAQESLPEFLSIINQESQRLTERVKLLLDVSQIEAGKVTFQRRPVDLAELLRESLEALEPVFAEKQIETELIVPPQPATAHCDRQWLGRALRNLLSNAAKFCHPKHRVEIEIRELGLEIQLSVQDEGPGIPAELQATIFERFKQIGEVLTDKPTGIGLGLPLARLVAEGHGGRIWVESKSGWGARFTLALPAGEPAPELLRAE